MGTLLAAAKGVELKRIVKQAHLLTPTVEVVEKERNVGMVNMQSLSLYSVWVRHSMDVECHLFSFPFKSKEFSFFMKDNAYNPIVCHYLCIINNKSWFIFRHYCSMNSWTLVYRLIVNKMYWMWFRHQNKICMWN